MTGAGEDKAGLSGVLRLTWLTDHLEHVIQHSQTDEPAGTWTGLACPDHGLVIGTDADTGTLQHLAQGELADLVWEAPPELSAEHDDFCRAAIHAYQTGDQATGEHLWQRAKNLWSHAWSANQEVLALMQQAGLTRFSMQRPQRWVVASFEHHYGPHGLTHPHIHNIVVTALTTGSA